MGKLTAVFDLYAASMFMTVVFLVIAVSATGEYLGVVTNGAPDSLITLHKLAKIVEFSFAPFIGVLAGMRSAWCSLRAEKNGGTEFPVSKRDGAAAPIRRTDARYFHRLCRLPGRIFPYPDGA